MILFLFGKPGTGKTFIGQKLAQLLRAPYFDCDECYTKLDILAIQQNTLTGKDSDSFLGRAIKVMQRKHNETGLLIASQSLFREKQRRKLKKEFGNNIFLIYLDVSTKIAIRRLVLRSRKAKPHFYKVEQYLREMGEYEGVATKDLIVKSTGNSNTIIRKISQRFKQYCLKMYLKRKHSINLTGHSNDERRKKEEHSYYRGRSRYRFRYS